MKKILILIFILKSIVFSNEDLNQTSLDMFLFKIGFKSLASEVEEQRKILDQNSLAIQKLQQQIDLLSDTKSKNKLSSNLNIANNYSKKQNTNLNNKLELLKIKLKKELINKKTIQKLPYKYAKVKYDNLKVHAKATSQSEVTKYLSKNTLLKIEYCDKYLWCKIYDEDSYVAKIRLKF